MARIPPPFAAALSRLRDLIRANVPDAEESISYGVPSYRWKGPLVSFGAAKKHCSLYGMSPRVLAEYAPQLAGYNLSPGTVRFTPEAPLPDEVVVSILRARQAENLVLEAARKARKTKARGEVRP